MARKGKICNMQYGGERYGQMAQFDKQIIIKLEPRQCINLQNSRSNLDVHNFMKLLKLFYIASSFKLELHGLLSDTADIA